MPDTEGTEATPAEEMGIARTPIPEMLPPAMTIRQRQIDREADMLNTRVVTWSLAVFSTVSYLVCIAYGLIVPESLHMSGFLEQVLPGFRWLTAGGFAIGLVEAFLYGAYIGLVFTPIYNFFRKRWGG